MKCNRKFYKCGVCGNIVGLIESGGGTLSCCGQPMTMLVPNSTDAAQEKHVPVLLTENGKLFVQIGSIPHPMTEEHFIKWIYICTKTGGYRHWFKPGDEPKVEINIKEEEIKTIFAYCNLHGLWQNEINSDDACSTSGACQ
ncbi:MAG: desulfoferrodoxin family protein [Bacillota bacterium]|nr:desulfoferrodoxin family protein [Bacillota bacterium]